MLSLSLLGPFQSHLNERPLTQFHTTKAQALLIYLAVEAHQTHQREALMALLWPGLPLQSAQQSLRQTLYRLRQVIEPDELTVPFILAERFTLAWNPDAPLLLDVAQFETLSGLGRSTAEWQQAADLYRGEFLTDFYLSDSEVFEEWSRSRRAAYQRTAQELLQRLAAHHLGQNAYTEAETAARRNLELDYFQEAAHRQLVEILAQGGRRQEALTHYDTLRQRLRDELAIEPEEETAELITAIRTGQLNSPAPASPAGRKPSLPVITHPNLSTPSQPLPNNLPIPPTPFIGREAELSSLDELMNQENGRLVTIVGPGGMGKTRLALAWAIHQAHRQNDRSPHPYRHGINFLNLAPLPSADLILPTLANVLNFSIQKSSDREQRPHKQQILDYLCQKQMLLLMDNFEHLVDGADLVADILAAAPHIKILVTSRERLNLRQEQVYPIQGLEFPDWETPEDAAEYTAVQLFLQSARRNIPDFALTGGDDLTYLSRICRLVAGMPLAIELAAAWVELLSLEEIAAEIQQGLDILETELRDVPPRQRSVRATIDYSWQKLNESEREIFTRLAVFRGGFTREAAQTISGASLRQLSHLQNKSLLQVDREGHRYQLHELLRQYAAEKLAHNAELTADVSGRHAHYYARFLADQKPLLHGPQESETLRKLDQDRENTDAAWHWLVAHKEVQPLLDSITSLIIYHTYRTRIQEGVARCLQIINWCSTPADDGEKLLLVRALNWHSSLTFNYLFEQETVEANLTQAADLLTGLSGSLSQSGFDLDDDWAFNHFIFGQYLQPGVIASDRAMEHFENALRFYRQAGNLLGMVRTLDWLSGVKFYNYHSRGGYKAALELSEQALTLARTIKSNKLMTELISNVGTIALQAGDMPLMARLMVEVEKALIQLKEEGNTAEQEQLLERYAWMLSVAGEPDAALAAQLEFQELRQELGLPIHMVSEFQLSQKLAHLGRYAEARERSDISMALVHQYPNEWALGLNLINLGMISLATGEAETAETVLRQGLVMQEKLENGLDLSGNLANLGLALCRLGNYTEAKERLLASLQLAVSAHAYLPLIEGLPAIALALAHSEPPQVEQAAEIYGLLLSQPYYANSHLFHDMSGRCLREINESLPPDQTQAAMERGKQMEIWAAAAELLESLQGIW